MIAAQTPVIDAPRLESFHSDAESIAGLDLNAVSRALTMCPITTGQLLSLVD